MWFAYVVPDDDMLKVVELGWILADFLLLLTTGNDAIEEHDERKDAQEDHQRLDLVPKALSKRSKNWPNTF